MKNILPSLTFAFGVALNTGAEAALQDTTPLNDIVKQAAFCITGRMQACESLLRYVFVQEEKPKPVPKYRRRHPEQEP